jgi:VanZ family protein
MKAVLSTPFKYAPRSSAFYVVMWVIWFLVLWYLSSRAPVSLDLPTFPHKDKVLHFGYFAWGGGFVAGALLNSRFKAKAGYFIVILAFLIGAATGILDEYRQSKAEGRVGNDPWDWAADCVGTIAGASCMVWGWRKWKDQMTSAEPKENQ